MQQPASWLPEKPSDFMQGESRGTGAIWHVAGWGGFSDRKKLRLLRDLAQRYGGDPHMRWHTVNVLRAAGVEPRDHKGQAAAILRYAQSLYYTNEPGEQIQTPWRTIAVGTGDCDDLAVLIAAMAESIRLPWRYVLAGRSMTGKTIRTSEHDYFPIGAQYSHIYCDLGWPPFSEGKTVRDAVTRKVRSATTWASAEPTIRGVPLGYDAVTHGVPSRALPELAGYGGPAMYGDDRFTQSTPSLPVTAPPDVPRAPTVDAPPASSRFIDADGKIFGLVPWRTFAIGVAQSAAAGLIIRLLVFTYTKGKSQ
jgi:hypothetical protein